MTTLERVGDVFVLDLGNGDNRFDATTVPAITAHLDTVASDSEQRPGPAALVTTATGKIWSNGLDLDYMGSLGEGWLDYIAAVQMIYARLLRLPMPTVAAIQGHAFAGGALLALAHDVRLMRADRGYFCLPEVDLRMPFSGGMAALIAAKVPRAALNPLAVLGERFGGQDAVTVGLVDATAPDEQAVRAAAIERAASLASKASPTLVALRRNFYEDAITALEPDAPGAS